MIQYLKNMEACNRHEKTCDVLVKHKFPGGKYDKSLSIFDKIENVYNDLIKKEKTYIMYHSFNPIVTNDDKYYPYECVIHFEALKITNSIRTCTRFRVYIF